MIQDQDRTAADEVVDVVQRLHLDDIAIGYLIFVGTMFVVVLFAMAMIFRGVRKRRRQFDREWHAHERKMKRMGGRVDGWGRKR